MQAASDAIFSRVAQPWSLPAHLHSGFGTAAYSAIERVAPAPYVEAMLAQAALDRGDLLQAKAHAMRLPVSGARDEMLGEIAQALGDQKHAEDRFIAADDIFSISRIVDALSVKNPAAAYNLEMRLADRLQRGATHPDAVADAYWRLGQLATEMGYRHPRDQKTWFLRGMQHYSQAVALSPISERYLIAAGVQALHLGDNEAAWRYFRRTADVNPGSADAYAGLGVASLRMGDRAAAQAYAAQSRAFNPNSHFLKTLDRLLASHS